MDLSDTPASPSSTTTTTLRKCYSVNELMLLADSPLSRQPPADLDSFPTDIRLGLLQRPTEDRPSGSSNSLNMSTRLMPPTSRWTQGCRTQASPSKTPMALPVRSLFAGNGVKEQEAPPKRIELERRDNRERLAEGTDTNSNTPRSMGPPQQRDFFNRGLPPNRFPPNEPEVRIDPRFQGFQRSISEYSGGGGDYMRRNGYNDRDRGGYNRDNNYNRYNSRDNYHHHGEDSDSENPEWFDTKISVDDVMDLKGFDDDNRGQESDEEKKTKKPEASEKPVIDGKADTASVDSSEKKASTDGDAAGNQQSSPNDTPEAGSLHVSPVAVTAASSGALGGGAGSRFSRLFTGGEPSPNPSILNTAGSTNLGASPVTSPPMTSQPKTVSGTIAHENGQDDVSPSQAAGRSLLNFLQSRHKDQPTARPQELPAPLVPGYRTLEEVESRLHPQQPSPNPLAQLVGPRGVFPIQRSHSGTSSPTPAIFPQRPSPLSPSATPLDSTIPDDPSLHKLLNLSVGELTHMKDTGHFDHNTLLTLIQLKQKKENFVRTLLASGGPGNHGRASSPQFGMQGITNPMLQISQQQRMQQLAVMQQQQQQQQQRMMAQGGMHQYFGGGMRMEAMVPPHQHTHHPQMMHPHQQHLLQQQQQYEWQQRHNAQTLPRLPLQEHTQNLPFAHTHSDLFRSVQPDQRAQPMPSRSSALLPTAVIRKTLQRGDSGLGMPHSSSSPLLTALANRNEQENLQRGNYPFGASGRTVMGEEEQQQQQRNFLMAQAQRDHMLRMGEAQATPSYSRPRPGEDCSRLLAGIQSVAQQEESALNSFGQ